MKIAYLGIKGLPSKSGTERVIEALVNRLTREHEITVYCDPSYTHYGTKVEGVRLIWLPTLKGKYLKPISYIILSSIHAFFSGDYDIIHLNGIENSFVLPLLRLRYPVISTSHGSAHSTPRDKWGKIPRKIMGLMEYPFVFFSNIATSVSRFDAVDLESRIGRRVIYIPNGVELNIEVNETESSQLLDQYNIDPNTFILFAAGRIDPTKGCHTAIEAYKIISPHLPLLILGDLEQIPIYGNSLRELANGHHIIFHPPVTDKSIFFGIVKSCKIFLFPSISEGMSMMLLEAASLGAPMICSDIPENMIVMKESTLYFRSGDEKDLAEKLQWAIQHPEVMNALSHKASQLVSTDYSWDKIVEQYELLLETCTKKGGYPYEG